ncbi:hypothetical protein [Piscinibacter sakaiensis]|uniref:hypothetical protein n=1 Tax=Piscinibacter sakaiensis TaxID=1547922 RepID=UPI003AB0DA65
MAAVTETRHPHPVRLRGAASGRTGAPALLPDIEAEDFVAVLGQAIKRSPWPRFGWPATPPLPTLAQQGAPRALFQPIHRRFNLLLLDTHCDIFGSPRLDPRRIESAGFVVRRWIGPDAGKTMPGAEQLASPAHWQAWQESDGEPLGWAPLRDQRGFDADPDPARRPLPRTGNAVVDAQLAARQSSSPGEVINRLYPLAPDVNDHARRTLLYGLVPAGEAQRKAATTAVDYSGARAPGEARDNFVAHLSPYLRSAGITRTLPNPNSLFDSSWIDGDGDVMLDAATDVGNGGNDLQRAQFTAFIRQLALEFEIDSARAEPLRRLLDEVPLHRRRSPVPPPRQPLFERIDTSSFIVACARLFGDETAPAVRLPELFGPLPSGWTQRFVDAALDLLSLRSVEARTLESRFDDDGALYAIRAFVRVKQGDGCPPLLVWSEMTPLYRIAPWFASTGAPQARIALPPFDKESLRAMKPNVAFDLPPSLQNLLMNNDPADLLAGKGKKGSEFGIGWLCSFSIPIITICAFILLNIVLSLLNIFLRWLPFVKICLPIPTKKP